MGKGFTTGMIIGAAIGAALGLIYAPSAGMETRKKWAEASIEAADKISKTASTIAERAAELEETLKQAI